MGHSLSASVAWLLIPLGIAAGPGCSPRAVAKRAAVRTSSGQVSAQPVAIADQRRFRGDWEPPSTLLLAYELGWESVLTKLAQGAREEADVIVVVRPEDADAARPWLTDLGLDSVVLDHDTGWIRDYGPFEITDETGERRWLDLAYGFGRTQDDALPQSLGELVGVPVEWRGVKLDGGALISDGWGLCAMTQSSFERFAVPGAPELSAATLEELGCRWLTVVPSLTEEDTGHIDVFAQFLTPVVVAVAELDPEQRPEDAAVLDQAVVLLEEGARHLGRRLEVVRVPLVVQGTVYYSYVNGTRLHHRFLTPAYLDVPESIQRLAYERLLTGLPLDVELVPIFVDEIVKSGGAVHCITLGLGDRLGPAVGKRRG